MNTQALRVCFGIISRPDFGGRCFLHDDCMAVHGTFCVCGCVGVKAAQMMKKSGAAFMRRKWKGRGSLMEKFSGDWNVRTGGV